MEHVIGLGRHPLTDGSHDFVEQHKQHLAMKAYCTVHTYTVLSVPSKSTKNQEPTPRSKRGC